MDTDMNTENIIEVRNLIKIYKQGDIEVIALHNLNMDVNKGEILCIMGPSGSGKSTLLNQIGAMDNPTGGIIKSCGKELTKLNEKGLTMYRTFDIGFLFQEFNLSPVLSAEENIMLPMKIAGKLPLEEQKKRTRELLKRIDLVNRAKHKPYELSGGEKQRVALLTAIANEPRILIADEPTGELDSATTEEILQLLKNIHTEYGLTDIIVTHNAAVSRIADRVLHLKDGQITSTYTPNMTLDGGEAPSFELDAGIVLKHLYPPGSCSFCQSQNIKLQEPSKEPEIYAPSTHGVHMVKLGFAYCNACGAINWGFKP